MPQSESIRQSIDVRRFPWIRPLVGAYANDFASVRALFAGNPAEPAAWGDAIARVTRSHRAGGSIGAIVGKQLELRGSPAAGRAAASSLTQPGSVAIVTGQQAGLFGGPLYTLLKAVTTIQLARRVAADHGVKAVPVFWVECEDHDWDEVRSARVLDADLATRDVELASLPGAGSLPVSSLRLDDSVAETVAALESALGPSEFGQDLFGALRAAYQPGVTMSKAFASWLDRLLGQHGLVVFEANDPAAKPMVAALFARELRHASDSTNLIKKAGEAMQRLGHSPQLDPADEGTGLFYLGTDGRKPIKRKSGGFSIGEMTRSVEELAKEAESHPERFSPNVFLRPLVQDSLFPTACYVGGPSELAYQAQLGTLYRAFGVEPPLLAPRVSATIVDSGAAKFLERSGIDLEALQPQDESALNRLLASLMPADLERAFGDTAEEVRARLAVIQSAVPAVDPTLAGAAETTRDRMLDSLQTLLNKIIQASKRKDETLRRQFQRTRALCFPGGDPQERAISLTFFLNRYGLNLPARLLEILPIDGANHFVVTL